MIMVLNLVLAGVVYKDANNYNRSYIAAATVYYLCL